MVRPTPGGDKGQIPPSSGPVRPDGSRITDTPAPFLVTPGFDDEEK